jgi:hypothetical protein
MAGAPEPLEAQIEIASAQAKAIAPRWRAEASGGRASSAASARFTLSA